MAQAPALVRLSNPLVRPLVRRLPMGPNGQLTVRGRKTGLPRTVPIAIIDAGGRRWLLGAYGDVQWVRNLRAAGEGEVTFRGRTDHVGATELSPEEAAAFFREVLIPFAARQPWILRFFIGRMLLGPILRDPDAAARIRPVFEIRTRTV